MDLTVMQNLSRDEQIEEVYARIRDKIVTSEYPSGMLFNETTVRAITELVKTPLQALLSA